MKRFIFAFAGIAFMALMFCDLGHFIKAGQQGLLLVAHNVLPVLFPFFFVSSMLVGLGFGNTGIIYLLSTLSGYPTGARLLSDLYQRGEISRNAAIKTATWTSTCSPAFVIGTVGTALCGNVKIGVVIFASHVLGALLNGLIYQKTRFRELTTSPKIEKKTPFLVNMQPIEEVLNTAIYSAIQGILAVCGWIVLFFVTASQLTAVAHLPHLIDIAASSLLEMTTGVFRAGANVSPVILCAIITFGGLSVVMQAQTFFKTFRLPLWFYFLYKATHTIIAALLCYLVIIMI